MNNSITSRDNLLIQKMFDTLTEKEKIIKFMLDYFKAFIVDRASPNNLDFQHSIDTVNKDLLLPLQNFTEENLKDLDDVKQGKISMWADAHREFEVKVIQEIGNFIK